jgi:signal transduction histidine kinase
LSQNFHPALRVSRPALILLVAVYFFYTTVVLRSLAEAESLGAWLPVYLALEFLFGLFYTLVLWRPIRWRAGQHLYFAFQTLIPLFLIYLHPRLDFTNILIVLLAFQAALLFTGRARWVWAVGLLVTIILSETILLGAYGLALALLPATMAIVLSAYVAIAQEIEAGQRNRQTLLTEMQEANQRLTAYSGQVEELSAIQERNRLARELHDSVSQIMFSISLHSRAARILFERDPERLRPQLEQLQTLTQDALKEMRSLIADLRPRKDDLNEGITT